MTTVAITLTVMTTLELQVVVDLWWRQMSRRCRRRRRCLVQPLRRLTTAGGLPPGLGPFSG